MSSVHTPGPWYFRSVVNEERTATTALILDSKAPDQPFNDPTVLAVREDWIHYLMKTPVGRANLALIAAAPDLGAVLTRLARSADALLGACNAADVGDIEDRKTACRDIADAHNAIQAAGLYGGGK